MSPLDDYAFRQSVNGERKSVISVGSGKSTGNGKGKTAKNGKLPASPEVIATLSRSNREEDEFYDIAPQTRKQKGCTALSLAFALFAVATLPVLLVLYRDWNAASWTIICATLSLIMFFERAYRRRCEINMVQPHDHIKPILLFAKLSFSASLSAVVLYICFSVLNERTFFPDGYAMSLCWSVFVLSWSTALISYGQKYHSYRKLNTITFQIVMAYSLFGFICGLVFVFIFTLWVINAGAAICGGIASFFAFLIGFEFYYRDFCLQRNKPTHNHLRILAILGGLGWVFGKIIITYFVGIAINQGEGWTPESYFIAAISAGMIEIYGFSLLWTVWHFRYTEVSVDLFFKNSINDPALLEGSEYSDDD